MSELKEYIVTLKNFSDSEEFYNDMETIGGPEFIPDREVDLVQRRPLSRNTHYLLTGEEAESIRQDPRVLAVELLPSELGIEVVPHWTQTGNFEKSAVIDSNDKNWGLLRVASGNSISDWGTNGTFTQTTATISVPYSGKNVDVVIVDAHINVNHPEFAVNINGTGGSRVIQYNWFSLSNIVGIVTTGSYSYSIILNNHGTHVAGTVAGNTQGWARDANIFNMEFNYTAANSPTNWQLYIFDYLRAFHKNKPINPVTGLRNPTVTNHSWGYSFNSIPLTSVTSVTYLGTTTSVTGIDFNRKSILEANGVPVPLGTSLLRTPSYYPALNADVIDAINDGVIVVASAGNSYWNIVTPSDSNYNNNIVAIFPSGTTTIYHSRGSSPGSSEGVICVGAIGVEKQEFKGNFSNYGSRVDIWAPGVNIISSVYNSAAATEFGITLANDPRNSSYSLGAVSGTSMSAPQVSGYIACLAEIYPRITQSEALDYVVQYSKKSQIDSTGTINTSPYFSLGDASNNRYLYYYIERPSSGNVYPSTNRKTRPSTGVMYPRSKIKR